MDVQYTIALAVPAPPFSAVSLIHCLRTDSHSQAGQRYFRLRQDTTTTRGCKNVNFCPTWA